MQNLLKILIISTILVGQFFVHIPGAMSQEAAPQESKFKQFLEQEYLFGDLGGVRSGLADHGVWINYYFTQFYQGVVGNSPGTYNWQYGFKGDFFVNIDSGKLGLWKGMEVNMHLETRVGDDINSLTGLAPANGAMVMPRSDDVTAITQVTFNQFLGKWPVTAMAGKVNAIDFSELLFDTGQGIHKFMNMSLVLPMGLGRSTALALPVVGFLKWHGKEAQGVAVIYGPENCATGSCFDDLFSDVGGLIVYKFYTGDTSLFNDVPVKGAKEEGYIGVGATYSNKQYSVVEPGNIYYNPAEGLIEFKDTEDSWCIASIIRHPLWADPSDPKRDLSFMGMFSVTDASANPISWSATAALEWNGPFKSRDMDRVGIGYFHTQLDSDFKDAVGPLLSLEETIETGMPTYINLEDTDGVELYYQAQVTPWFALTGDLQVITETLSSNDTRFVAGIRAKISL